MKYNFTIMRTNDMLFCANKHIASVVVKCNNCQKDFTMGYVGTANMNDGTWNKKYEYNYCPHCAKELKENDK